MLPATLSRLCPRPPPLIDIGCAPLPYPGVNPELAPLSESCRPPAFDLPLPPVTLIAEEERNSLPVVVFNADVRYEVCGRASHELFLVRWAMLMGADASAIAPKGGDWLKSGNVESSKSDSNSVESRYRLERAPNPSGELRCQENR